MEKKIRERRHHGWREPRNRSNRRPRGFESAERAHHIEWVLMNAPSSGAASLVRIKLLHTAIWLFFAGCIVAIPLAGMAGQYVWAAALSGFVLLECAVLALNRGRCPLTDVAGRYTEERTDNFDIYLPVWLARHNKTIFGTLFVLGELFVLARWLRYFS